MANTNWQRTRERLRAVVWTRGVSAVAREVGVSRACMYRWLGDENVTPIPVLRARVLDVVAGHETGNHDAQRERGIAPSQPKARARAT